MTQKRAVDVKVNGRWVTYESAGQAATHIGVSQPTLSKYLRQEKPCNGFEIRWHEEGEESEIDRCLREIDERNRQPYEFSNGRTARSEEPVRMTRTELVTRLCEHTAGLEELRTQFQTEWLIDTRLKDVTSRLQMLMKEIQEGGRQ